MTGWAAYRLSTNKALFSNGISSIDLPNKHPYKNIRPVMDAEDFPYRYIHNEKEWTAWGSSIDTSEVRINGGGERVATDDFERVFYDDFRNNRVKASFSGESDLWSAPGFNPAVGASAQLMPPSETFNVYPHDEDEKNNLFCYENKTKDGKRVLFIA